MTISSTQQFSALRISNCIQIIFVIHGLCHLSTVAGGEMNAFTFYGLFVVFIRKIVVCDWVEIKQINEETPPIRYDQPVLDSPVILATTPASYEFIMKTPFYTESSVLTTIPAIQLELTSLPSDNVIPRSTIKSSKIKATKNENMNFTSFIPVIESIQKTLMQNRDNSVTSKIKMLKQLRDTILLNIGDKMLKLWSPEKREARGYKDDYNMDFPSNEGALMTIGFLTFAVFLVKLVLKLIYALKYKQQYYYTTTTTTAATLFLREQRNLDDDEGSRILKLIDEFKLN